MTEQEKRFEEMAQLRSIVCNGCYCSLCLNCAHYRRIEILYDAGYRKADEVRKETAKEFSNRVDEIVDWCTSNNSINDFDYEYFINCLRNLKKEFGVEVEE